MPGADRLRSDHVTHLPVATYTSLARLIQLILEGRTLPSIARWLLSNSKLLIFPKRDNQDARTGMGPIRLPELLRKLAGKSTLEAEDCRLLSLDFSNAFNTLKRQQRHIY